MKADMRRRFEHLTKSSTAPNLPVHCISNSGYQELVKPSARTGNFDDHDLSATGIPELRAVLYHAMADGKLAVLVEFLRFRIPQLLDRVTNLVNKSQISSKKAIIDQLGGVYGKSSDLIRQRTESLKEDFRQALHKVVSENATDWSENAMRQLGKKKPPKKKGTTKKKAVKDKAPVTGWRAYRPNTFKAFCTYDGVFKPPRHVEDSSWNQAIRDIMRSGMKSAFEQLNGYVEKTADILEASVKEWFENLLDHLKGNIGSCSLHILTNRISGTQLLGHTTEAQAFYTWLEGERDRALSKARKAHGTGVAQSKPLARSLAASFGRISFQTIGDGEYVRKAMEKTYAVCDKINAAERKAVEPTPGRKTRKKHEMISMHEQRVERIAAVFPGSDEQRSVFVDVKELANADWQKAVTAWMKALERDIEKSRENILKEFGYIFEDAGEKQVGIDAAAAEILSKACESAMEEVQAGEQLVAELEEMDGANAAAWAEIGAR